MNLLCKEKILSNDYADWIIDFELTEELQRLDQSGVDYCYNKIDDALGIVYAKRSQMDEIGVLNYPYQQIPSLLAEASLFTEETDSVFDPIPLAETGISRIQREPLKLRGKGTVMVFIGSGIDYTNSVFRKSDGSTRILAVWDQNVQEGPPPATASPAESRRDVFISFTLFGHCPAVEEAGHIARQCRDRHQETVE